MYPHQEYGPMPLEVYRIMQHLLAAFLLLFPVSATNVGPIVSDDILTAQDLLETIAPSYHLAQLPPGFPALKTINTDKFSYKTEGKFIRVSANLDKPVPMFKKYIELSNVKMNFTYNKKRPRNGTWKITSKGSWAVGSTILHVDVTKEGEISASAESIQLTDILAAFLPKDKDRDVGLDPSSIILLNITVSGQVYEKMNGFTVTFNGQLDLESFKPVAAAITVSKRESAPMEIYSVLEFENLQPKGILKRIINQKTLNVPFFSNMLSSSDLMNEAKDYFGIAFSYGEVYDLRLGTRAGDIISSVLQSHVPAGITLLCPLRITPKTTVRAAFVINKPNFDLLIDKDDKIPIRGVLQTLSGEFGSFKELPSIIAGKKPAYTTHVSFDSSTSVFSMFVRLKKYVRLAKRLLKIRVSNVVLQRNVAESKNGDDWKVSAKGTFKIGKKKIHVQYAELSDEKDKPFGLTGEGTKLSLDDIIQKFSPDIYPDSDTENMIENTEINNFKIDNLRVFSRIPKSSQGTPHLLMTGTTDLSAWEKRVQVALLLLNVDGKWKLKMATSFKQSPLSNIIEALTGFDCRDIYLLHNTHIMTTLISSPFDSYSMLPPHIITTPLLRLPVAKALTIIALIRFPDNCGDDKMCMTTTKLLGSDKVYTVKGVLSLSGFTLNATLSEDISLTKQLTAVNNTLQFKIGNTSSLSIRSTIRLPGSNMLFDGQIHIYKTGQAQLQMSCRQKLIHGPFNLDSLSLENIQLVMFINLNDDSPHADLEGMARIGAQGNGAEMSAPVKISYNFVSPYKSLVWANFTEMSWRRLLQAFTIETQLPQILASSRFPDGLMLSLSPSDTKGNNKYALHGDIEIFGRLLSCELTITHPGTINLETEYSPAPIIFAKGTIIIQKSSSERLRGPRIQATLNHKAAKLSISGYVKMLGMGSDTNIEVTDEGMYFELGGKLMEFKDTLLHAQSDPSADNFQVFGCFEDVARQVEELLREIVLQAANQSSINMAKSEENLLFAQRFYDIAVEEEIHVRTLRDQMMVMYEENLLEYGRYEVKVNDTCVVPKCETICFGCPKLNRCCRLDIFGHCIACSAWKKCCWKNINPLCISKHDGCHVIRTLAEKELASNEAAIIQQRISLDNLEQQLIQAEQNKGKHKAVLEAAIDAKQMVVEESSPGLNAADALRNFGQERPWIKIYSVCYNTSIEQATTGCMVFHLSGEFFGSSERNVTIFSCLKEDLVTELTESLANYIFPKIVDTSADDIEQVATEMTTTITNGPMNQTIVESPLYPTSGLHVAPVQASIPTDPDMEDDFLFPEAAVSEPQNNGEGMKPGNLTGPANSTGSIIEEDEPLSETGSASGSGLSGSGSGVLVPPSENKSEDENLMQTQSGPGVVSRVSDTKAVEDLSEIEADAETSGEDDNSEEERRKMEMADQIVEDEEMEGQTRSVTPSNGTALIIPRSFRDAEQARNYINEVDVDGDLLNQGTVNSRFRRSINPTTKHIRRRRDVNLTPTNHPSNTALHGKATRLLFSNPFWNVKSDRTTNSLRSRIPLQPLQQKFMSGMIHKRWKIPDSPVGRCHIFHQLIAICKDMADTLVTLDKALKESKNKYLDEDKRVFHEVDDATEFLLDAASRVNVSSNTLGEVEKTLDVVKEGVNIWSKRCSNEFDWQNNAGVQTWLTAMDLRIQELGGFGVYRFLENLFHAFEALFEVLTYSDNTAKEALSLLQRIRRISVSFDKIFKDKLSVIDARPHANDILLELGQLRKESLFC